MENSQILTALKEIENALFWFLRVAMDFAHLDSLDQPKLRAPELPRRLETIIEDFAGHGVRSYELEQGKLVFALTELRSDLANLSRDPGLSVVLQSIATREYVTDRTNYSYLISRQLADFLSLDESTAIGAVEQISELARQLMLRLGGERKEPPNERKVNLERLRQLLPGQKIAPVQFTVTEGRIAIAPHTDEADARDVLNVKAAREQLLSGGQRILKELKGSNCDKRLIETVQFLHEQIASEQNVVQLGIANIGCDLMYAQFQAELPDALLAMLRAQTVSITMYIAQFPDWHRFVENAALVEIDQSEIARIHATADKLAADLRAKPDIADPQVPATLEWLSRMLADPANTTKRLAHYGDSALN
jgi:hypothetical protein